MNEQDLEIVLTPDFLEDMASATNYIQNNLCMPKAARNLFEGIFDALENQKTMPTAALRKTSNMGDVFYYVKYHKWNAFYVIEESAIKVIGLRHDLQSF